MKNKTILFCAGLLLSGCASNATIGSISGGECRLPGVHTPKYKVLGKTRYDQNWSDDTTEGLVRGCRQARPLVRPASFDKPKATVPSRPTAKPVAAKIELKRETPAPVPTLAPRPQPKKKHWWQRN